MAIGGNITETTQAKQRYKLKPRPRATPARLSSEKGCQPMLKPEKKIRQICEGRLAPEIVSQKTRPNKAIIRG